jgi:hypothetical protein
MMGIRDYLRDWADPNPDGWSVGDSAITTFEKKYSGFTVPAGAPVVIDSVPEARHGADPYAMGSMTWEGHVGLECTLSSESAEHHSGGASNVPCVVKNYKTINAIILKELEERWGDIIYEFYLTERGCSVTTISQDLFFAWDTPLDEGGELIFSEDSDWAHLNERCSIGYQSPKPSGILKD